jgi:ribose transport system permease protein
MTAGELYAKYRYRLLPDHVLGELLSKNWIDNAIPVFILGLVLTTFGILIDGFWSVSYFSTMFRQMGELMFVVLGMTIVIMGGGVDLSVGAVFALANFVALFLINTLGLPVPLVITGVLAVGAFCGLINGVLIGYFKLRAFLSTLATLIIIGSFVEILTFNYASTVVMGFSQAWLWNLFALGNIGGLPANLVIGLVVAGLLHIFLSRMRTGWHISAVGGSRRSSHNAGINVRRTVCITYVMSGMLASFAGMLYAARLNSAGAQTGAGLELTVLTAALLGGNSLGGGRGSVAKALLGTLIVVILTNSLLRMQMPSGSSSLLLAMTLLFAVAIDIRWLKNRHKLLNKVYVSPTYYAAPEAASTDKGSGSPYEMNDILAEAEPIGLNMVDGAEDLAFDKDDNIYTGSRHGDIIRFMAPDYAAPELFVHIGGHPLGLHFDADGDLHACVSGMGLYKVRPDRTVVRLADETNRSLLSIIDDSRMRFADDMDFAPDGRIYFSEATIRYDQADWATDSLEGRGNGRILCFDPRTGRTRTVLPKRMLPNGICMTGDGESLLFAETWACRVSRFWFAGPRKGKVVTIMDDIPGYPDNIRRTSDGHFWVAIFGMRTPALDLAMRMPGFRRRMAQRVAFEEWIYPNLNTGGVVKFDVDGRVLQSLWDSEGKRHPMVTSIREHKGYLYLAGAFHNRLGRLKLPDADPTFVDRKLYFGGTR